MKLLRALIPLLIAGVATAQVPPAAVQKGKQAFELMKQARYEEALGVLDEIDAMGVRSFAVAFNRARCLEQLGRIEEAIAALKSYLRDEGAKVPPDQLKEAHEKIAALSARIYGSVDVQCADAGLAVRVEGRDEAPAPCPARVADVRVGRREVVVLHDGREVLRRPVDVGPGVVNPVRVEALARLGVTADVAGAQVAVDGTPWGPAPILDRLVAPGAHRVVVQAEGHDEAVREVALEPGATLSLPMTLARAGDDAGGPGNGPWLLMGAGGALLLTGVVLNLVQVDLAHDGDAAEASYKTGAIAAYGVGGALAAAGLVWFVW